MNKPNCKTVPLGDIFTEEQCQHILVICQRNTLADAIKELRPWYESLRGQLLAKELLPEYAAYAVTYMVWHQLHPS